MSKIIVYSAPNCFKCTQLKNKLVQKSVEFEEINVRENVEALNMLKDNGFRELPVIKNGESLLTKDQFESMI